MKYAWATLVLLIPLAAVLVFYQPGEKALTPTEAVARLFGDVDTQTLSIDKGLGGSRVGLRPDFTLEDDFASHLPLLILETSDSSTPDAGLPVLLSVIDNVSGSHRPHDAPAFQAPATFLRASADAPANLLAGPPQGTLRLDEETGRTSLLGMSAASEWTLLGSAVDAGQLRQGLANALAATMNETRAPRMRYCEVLRRVGDRHEYLGVALFSEYLSEGIPFTPEALADKAAIIVPEPPGGNDATLALFHPAPESVTPAATEAFTRIHEMNVLLRTDDPNRYYQQIDQLDLGSFVDDFLLNEFMINQPATDPFHLAQRTGDDTMLSPPILSGLRQRFDESLDNGAEPSNRELGHSTRYLWFDRLGKGVDFADALWIRYYALSRRTWSAASTDVMLDDLGNRLGRALERDWTRWADLRAARFPTEASVVESDRQRERRTESPWQELLRCKRILRERGEAMKKFLREDRWREFTFYRSMHTEHNFILATVYAAVFFLLTFYARWKAER